jgi:hypothetical protein
VAGRGAHAGIVALAALGAWAGVARAADATGASHAAAEPQDPFKAFGLHLVDDLTLKWRDAIPEFAAFDAADAPGWNPWGEAEADASLPTQSGRLKLGLGVGRLGLHIDSHTIVEGTAARVRIRLGLDLGGGRLTLRLPDVKVTPRFDKGQVGFDWFVPLVEERF